VKDGHLDAKLDGIDAGKWVSNPMDAYRTSVAGYRCIWFRDISENRYRSIPSPKLLLVVRAVRAARQI
jgi:hypothetical protein